MCVKIGTLLNGEQFNVCGNVRIVHFEKDTRKNVTDWESIWGNCYLPDATDLLNREVTALFVTEDGWLEIEYCPDEFMGYN